MPIGTVFPLYFYNPSVTPDGGRLVFYSDRSGLSNLFRLDLASGEIVQVTDSQPARAEYWPFTPPIRGVAASDGRLMLQVADNGRGISREELLGSKSLGLTGMRERISLLGGKLDIEGAPGQGTTVLVELPLNGIN
jgi:signal transduction histidine kinase